ncbi:Alpha crystallin [Handroanthus impetiginosus]|uniref:Alpha crystallin n=1 Tax=Handroanthus impetiginosus TaxID=429701 RepID=A0A2G9GYR5_9LAMI|nr:Alpha crystallin [Handroanthus impetiginosus]
MGDFPSSCSEPRLLFLIQCARSEKSDLQNIPKLRISLSLVLPFRSRQRTDPSSREHKPANRKHRAIIAIAPSQLIGRAKEQDDCYKLRCHVPGLGKDDVKITVDDGVLNIRGERKEEEEEGSNDEFWLARSYGYYNSSVVLPEDAKDGVLNIVISKSERVKKDVKEIEVQ